MSYADINTAGGSGLYDYYGKRLAISLSEVRLNEEHAEKVYMIREVTAIQKLEQEVRVKLARKRYTSRYTMDDILGSSEEIRSLKKLAGRIAVFDQPVYIYGESGTGKELFAQAIHACSRRANGPFIAVNFAAMSESLLESELFGYAGAEIKKGVYVAHLGDNEVDEEMILRADKLVIDDWETDKHRMGDTMAYMFRDGKIDDSRIDASVSDLVAGRKSGRGNDDQLTYTCNVGLGLYDVAIAARVYQYAKENGIGQKLKLWDEPIMV